MDSIDTGKAAIILMSLQMAPDSKAERIGSAPESSSKTIYSLDEWELQRGHITNLYVTHKKTLPQVMDLMESRYGFVASQRQYKRRFAKWGLDTKNIRDHDMRLALAKDLKRKREGKDTEFEINGRLLPRQKMQRFMVRKELSEEDLIRSDAPTPPYVTYHTPHPVEDDDVTNTLASISLGKDEVMKDTCATHDEGTENLFGYSKIIQPDKRREEHASASVSIFSSSGEVSEGTSKILERNEAWLERRFKARNNPELILAYARLILMCNMIQRSTTLHNNLSIWKSYFERRLETMNSDPYMEIWRFRSRHLIYLINETFSYVDKRFLDPGTFQEDSVLRKSRNYTEPLPLITTEEPSLPHFATNKLSDHDKLLRKAQSNSSMSRSEPVLSDIREEPFRELQPIPTASPFERWSQRYDISSSPNWIRSQMSPRNPLLLSTPAPIGTPWDHIQRASPRPTSSQGYGSRVFNSDNFLVDDGISRGLHDQAVIGDLISVETKVHSGEVLQRWEPGEDFVLAPVIDAHWQRWQELAFDF